MDLDAPFALRERPGLIRVRVEANTDPEELGHPLVAVGYERESFLGFPSVEARVEYDGQGPRAFMGWLQVVERRDDDGNGAVEVDAVPVFGEESPLYTFGYAPTLADFPANPTHPDPGRLSPSSWQSQM